MATVTVSQAREVIPDRIDLVLKGEEVTLTRHGRPVVILVRPDRLTTRPTEGAGDVSDVIEYALERGRNTPLSDLPGLSVERAEALFVEVRAGRSRRRL